MGQRLADWRQRLDAVLRDSRAFAWGDSDCCTFAARCVCAMTGANYAASYHRHDEFHAGRIVRSYGGVDGIATKHLGPSKGALFALPGDVVLVEAPRQMLGICVVHRVAVQGGAGVEYVPLSAALAAWSV